MVFWLQGEFGVALPHGERETVGIPALHEFQLGGLSYGNADGVLQSLKCQIMGGYRDLVPGFLRGKEGRKGALLAFLMRGGGLGNPSECQG